MSQEYAAHKRAQAKRRIEMKSSKRFALMTFAATVTIVGILTFMIQDRSLNAASVRSRNDVFNPLFAKQWPSLHDKSLTSDLGPREMPQHEKAGNQIGRIRGAHRLRQRNQRLSRARTCFRDIGR